MVHLLDLFSFVFLISVISAKFPEIENGDSEILTAIKSGNCNLQFFLTFRIILTERIEF